MTHIRSPLYFAVLAAVTIMVAGCGNTVRGAAQDVQNTGEAVENAVE